jgi:hypothetical protein
LRSLALCQEVGEGSADLEASGVLKELELERQREWRQTEVSAATTGVRRTRGAMSACVLSMAGRSIVMVAGSILASGDRGALIGVCIDHTVASRDIS